MWWERIIQHPFTPLMWMENFRVSRKTFLYTCEELQPKVVKWTSNLETRYILVEEGVAVTLWFLATPGVYRTIAHLFEIARYTVCTIVRDVHKAIIDALSPQYISFPSGNELLGTVSAFEAMYGVPQSLLEQ